MIYKRGEIDKRGKMNKRGIRDKRIRDKNSSINLANPLWFLKKRLLERLNL